MWQYVVKTNNTWSSQHVFEASFFFPHIVSCCKLDSDIILYFYAAFFYAKPVIIVDRIIRMMFQQNSEKKRTWIW